MIGPADAQIIDMTESLKIEKETRAVYKPITCGCASYSRVG